MALKPVYSVDQIAAYLTDSKSPAYIPKLSSNTITYNIEGLTANGKHFALLAMQAWSEICNVKFVESTGAATISFDDEDSAESYTVVTPGNTRAINIPQWVCLNGTDIGTRALQTFLHEIGHALGLGHGGPYKDAAVSYDKDVGQGDNIYLNDTRQFSVMSYFRQGFYGESSDRHVSTPMIADILAIQKLYGANTQTRNDDTVYGYNTNGGEIYDFPSYELKDDPYIGRKQQAPALTIWDGGGTDTLDLSGADESARIDLTEGAFSDVMGLKNNIAIARGTTIENAIGTRLADRITGNNAQRNELIGGEGDDTLISSAGREIAFTRVGSWSGYGPGDQGWKAGDFNGDGKADILRHVSGGPQVILSTGSAFGTAVKWTGYGSGDQGWKVGDFNGDGKADLLRHLSGTGAQVLLSTGSAFGTAVTWTGAGAGDQGWRIGDFNGDGKSDLLRHVPGSGAQVLLSNGSSFAAPLAWTGSGRGNEGWFVGDFNGDGKDDVLRQVYGVGGQVLLSTGSKFASPIKWTGFGSGEVSWKVADFNGDGRSDLLRHVYEGSSPGAQVLLSNGSGFVFTGTWTGSGSGNHGWYTGDFDGDGKADAFRYISGVSGSDMHLTAKPANLLSGGAGNDTLIGGAGADHFLGGAGIDTASYEKSWGVTVAILDPGSNKGDAIGDTFAFVENILGTSFADQITGNNLNNQLTGGAGNDVLRGLRGLDQLTGGKGADRIYAGLDDGRDSIVIETRDDSYLGLSSDQIFEFDAKSSPGETTWDRINLSKLDGDPAIGDQPLRFVTSFTSPAGDQPDGQVTIRDLGDEVWKVLIDLNGDNERDMEISLIGVDTLSRADFLL